MKVKGSLNDNTLNSGTINNHNTDVDVQGSGNNNKVAVGGSAPDTGQIAGRDTAPNNTNSYNNNSNQGNSETQIDVVDNTVLANVNVELAGGILTARIKTITVDKSQHAETKGSFHDF